MSENYQARKYHIVLNNPKEHDMDTQKVQDILNQMHLDYYCMASEISDTGTPHIHIFIYSAISPIRFTTIKNKFPTAHIEKAYGSIADNREYVSKEGKWADSDKAHTVVEGSFFEKGEAPTENEEKAPLMVKLMEMISQKKSTAEIIKEYPRLAFKITEINSLRELLLSEKYANENRCVRVIYVYGKTGTGKTSGIYAKYHPSDICRITNYKGDRILFDAYHGQLVLVLEEFRSQIPISDLLSILDIYPVMLPARYSDRIACYEEVYIVSNIPLSQQYTSVQREEPETWNAFLRRINVIREYREDRTYEDTYVERIG